MPKPYRIVYEDDSIIVVDKPSGALVIQTPKKEKNTLTDILNQDLDERMIEPNAYPCHRLDRETSGLIVYAKGKSIQRLMMDEFRNRNVKKVYTAFVQGIIKKNFDTIKGSVYNRNKSRLEHAVTGYKVLERRRNFTVVEVEPVTGRTNQIRIQFKEIGHPLVGESVYAFRKDFKLRFKRVALHAKYIEFTHPVTKKRVSYSSPLPKDLKNFLKTGG